jgi:hypothetical protein
MEPGYQRDMVRQWANSPCRDGDVGVRVSPRQRPYTHVCLDCGALGVAGGYHDHGGGAAGDTIALKDLPNAIRAFQEFETEVYELREELGR